MKKYLLIWVGIWIVIAILVSAFGYSNALGGVFVAALVSLFFLIKILADNWSGEVTEIKKEDVYTSDEDGGSTNSIEFAYIKLTNGKVKKTQNLGWKVGDKLEKLRGEASVKVLK